MMLIKISWRNIWRNKVRSLVVIFALALGLWAGIFVSAFVNGMMRQKVDSVVNLELSHIQIHQPGFREDLPVKLYMDNGVQIANEIRIDGKASGVSARTASMVMLGSAVQNGGAKLNGIVPEDEDKVTSLRSRIIEGDFFETEKKNSLVISKEIADKYKVGLKSKLIVTLQDIHGEITAAAFKVIGIYKSENNMFDKVNIYARITDVQKLTNMQGIHEVAILLNDHEQVETYANALQKRYSTLEVLPWLDLASGMRYMIEVMGKYTIIIVSIVLLALLFSIINTMLMAVLERVKELGMLMAIGMTKGKVFSMIMLETLFLSLIGGPMGLLFAWLTVIYFGEAGINLSGAAYSEFGFAAIIYPYLSGDEYVKVSLMVFIMAIVAALYPARKALKLKPVEAIRKI